MKHIKLLTLIFGVLLLGCNQSKSKTPLSTDHTQTLSADPNSSVVSDEKENLVKLVRSVYEWHETKSSQSDFEPTESNKDSIYTGLDLKKHEQRLEELKQSGFFADQFLDNYDKIARHIDKALKSKAVEWRIGDLPPFGNDANPWCNCQDNPDNYWQTITINETANDNPTATFNWTWGDSFEYKVKASKQGDNWKIIYLQGFDFNEFTRVK